VSVVLQASGQTGAIVDAAATFTDGAVECADPDPGARQRAGRPASAIASSR
jgi:hypothetical protein